MSNPIYLLKNRHNPHEGSQELKITVKTKGDISADN